MLNLRVKQSSITGSVWSEQLGSSRSTLPYESKVVIEGLKRFDNMLAITDIQLNNIFIGKVRIDSTQIRGEGGWLDPHLIIPIEIELYHRPENQQLVLTGISYSLKLNGNPGTANQIGSSAHLNLIWNMNYRTFPNAPTANTLQLSFQLTQEQVKKLEEAREDSHQDPFMLYVELDGVIAWLAGTGNSIGFHQPKPSTLRGENLP